MTLYFQMKHRQMTKFHRQLSNVNSFNGQNKNKNIQTKGTLSVSNELAYKLFFSSCSEHQNKKITSK